MTHLLSTMLLQQPQEWPQLTSATYDRTQEYTMMTPQTMKKVNKAQKIRMKKASHIEKRNQESKWPSRWLCKLKQATWWTRGREPWCNNLRSVSHQQLIRQRRRRKVPNYRLAQLTGQGWQRHWHSNEQQLWRKIWVEHAHPKKEKWSPIKNTHWPNH